jgi:hypothetical protein
MNWYNKQIKIAAYNTYISPNDEVNIVNLRKKKNIPINRLSKMFHTSPSFIKKILRKHNVEFRENKQYTKMPIISDSFELRKKVNRLYDLPPDGQGLSVSAVAKALGFQDNSMRNYFQRIGKPIRGLKEYMDTPYYKTVTEQHSQDMKKMWAERGGLSKYLTTLDKQKALNFLKGFVTRLHQRGNPQAAAAILSTYLPDIESRPDEPQPPQ